MSNANTNKYKMSQDRLDEIKNELDFLQTVRAKEVSELIKEARSFGDLSENSEYDEAKTEQGKLYSRIAELKNLVENAEVVEKVTSSGKVVIGSIVTVRNTDEGYDDTYTIVGSQEANPMEGRISGDSPIGAGLVGRVVGDEVAVEAPAGKMHFKILEIKHD